MQLLDYEQYILYDRCMGFFRTRTIKKRQYLYYEERWREGGKVRSRSRLVKSSGVVATLQMTVGLPLMIAHDVISGARIKEMQDAMARRGESKTLRIVYDPRLVVSESDWEARRNQMPREEFDRYLMHAKAHIDSGKYESNSEAMKAARVTHAQSWDARDKAEKQARAKSSS